VGDVFANVNARINLFTALASEGECPDADELFDIVDAAAAVGAHEEVYRAIVNFLWSGLGYLTVERIEAVVTSSREGRVAAPPMIGGYLELSRAAMLYIPAGRWAEADAILARIDGEALSATSDLLWRPTVGGLALRRGDMEAADAALAELRSRAVASGEPQRIVPMAGVVLPWLLASGRRHELRSAAQEVVAVLDGNWPGALSVNPVVTALFAAEEYELLAVVTAALRRAGGGSHVGRRGTSAIAAEGLDALANERAAEAVDLLSTAVSREQDLGLSYDGACLKLPLAQALERAGRAEAAGHVEREAMSYFAALGCVHPV
jgi:hypothetical protein